MTGEAATAAATTCYHCCIIPPQHIRLVRTMGSMTAETHHYRLSPCWVSRVNPCHWCLGAITCPSGIIPCILTGGGKCYVCGVPDPRAGCTHTVPWAWNIRGSVEDTMTALTEGCYCLVITKAVSLGVLGSGTMIVVMIPCGGICSVFPVTILNTCYIVTVVD